MKNEDNRNWGPHWTSVNEEFEAKLDSNPHLKFLYGRMFHVCKGNQGHTANERHYSLERRQGEGPYTSLDVD